MEDRTLSQKKHAGIESFADKAISALLRYDLSRTNAVQWIYFARQILLVIFSTVVIIIALSAFLSIRRVEGLLNDSLTSQAYAIADSVARASFVPLTLDDEKSLQDLIDSYQTVRHLGSLQILGPNGKVEQELIRGKTATHLLTVNVPIMPYIEAGSRNALGAPKPVGYVNVGMRMDWINLEADRIALTYIATSGGFAILIFVIGALIIRNLIVRMRELVGEAQLVAEVKRMNSELEAFSYSVAHDLRSPLRSIDGFSQMLLEDYKDKIDENGKDLLRRVRAGSSRMGQLIDDLLNLSHVTRKVMRQERINLSELAQKIAAELKAARPERAVEFIIADKIWTQGDLNLIRIALENLLGNAWKYTKHQDHASIEFGVIQQPGKKTYFVRDNGAGFDMAFSDKLFKAFSRLHSTKDFEGTGIGLATVSRIIERHGGRIWGEGAVGKGATFFFTLK